jgi:hypothetical protein
MTIPNSQLVTWCNQGATVTAAATHTSIRNALSNYDWPEGVSYDDYLQGSYRNSTNIRGDSDVDLVAELSSTFYFDLTEDEKKQLGIIPASYGWLDFRRDVISALTNYYGSNLIDTSGSKSIKVLPSSGRLRADVVVAATYRYYSNLTLVAEGILFRTMPLQRRIINYPKRHYDNGAAKNSQHRTNSRYKPTIRMFKNARSRIYSDQPNLDGRFPSYFVECLLYNVPDDKFANDYQNRYAQIINWLNNEFNNDRVDNFVCQNEMTYLFGSTITQWNKADARELINQLIDLWNDW